MNAPCRFPTTRPWWKLRQHSVSVEMAALGHVPLVAGVRLRPWSGHDHQVFGPPEWLQFFFLVLLAVVVVVLWWVLGF